jgi:hypothetical protein
VTALQWWTADAEALAALLLVAYHYLVLHGWRARLLAVLYGCPDPGPTAHAHWEKSWGRRTRAGAYALGLAWALMLAASWSYSLDAGLAFTGAAELAASLVMRRSHRRAAQAEGQAHEHS